MAHQQSGAAQYPVTYKIYWIGYVLLLLSIGGAMISLMTETSLLWAGILACIGLVLSMLKIVQIPTNHFYVLKLFGNFRRYLRGGGGNLILLFRFFTIDDVQPYWVNRQITIDLKDVANNRTPDEYPYQLEGTLILRHDPTLIPERQDKIDLADEYNLKSILIHNAKLLVHKEVQAYLYALEHESHLAERDVKQAISDRIQAIFENMQHPYGLLYADHSNVAVYSDLIDRKRQEARGDAEKPMIAYENLRDYLRQHGVDLDELRRYSSAHRPVHQQERAYEFSRGKAKHERKAEEAARQQELENQNVLNILEQLQLDKGERGSVDYGSAIRVGLLLLKHNLWDGSQRLYLENVHQLEQWLRARSDIELQQLTLADIPDIQDETSRMEAANNRLNKGEYRSVSHALLQRAREDRLKRHPDE